VEEALFEAIPVRYIGLYADHHFVDGQQFGRSVVGISKIANSICHSLFFSEVTHDPRSYHIRLFVAPSKQNGLLQEFFAIVNSGTLPLFHPLAIKIAKIFVEKIFDAIIKTVSGKNPEATAVLETLREHINRSEDQKDKLIEGTLQNQQWLQSMVERLVPECRAPLRDVAEPVGRTVRLMRIGDQTDASPIDEATAEVIRSKEALAVGDSKTYLVKLEGVFKTNGACKVRIAEDGRIVPGKITDPSVGTAGNVYTRALNDAAELIVTAKPTLKDGQIKRLFISDAKISGDA
jgi:hypothetical protein